MTQTGIILKDTGPLILSTIYDMTMWMGFNVTLKLSWQHRNLNTLTSMQTTVVSLCVIAHNNCNRSNKRDPNANDGQLISSVIIIMELQLAKDWHRTTSM